MNGTRDEAGYSLLETLVGFAIAVATGIAVGAILGRIFWLELMLRPIIVALQVVPKVALIPIFIILFGFGVASKIVTAAILAFFPIMLNVMLGVRSVSAGHREVMQSLGAGRWQTFRHLDFPVDRDTFFLDQDIVFLVTQLLLVAFGLDDVETGSHVAVVIDKISLQRLTVDIQALISVGDLVSRDTDHTLDVIDGRVGRIMEHEDVAALGMADLEKGIVEDGYT